MKKISFITMLFIAVCVVSTGAIGQKVYRCGSTYSHIPCPDAVTVDAVDVRSKTQKSEADKAIARATATANTLEKDRLKTEAQAWANNKAQADKIKKQTAKPEETVGTQKTNSKKKDSELFTAASAPAAKNNSAPTAQTPSKK